MKGALGAWLVISGISLVVGLAIEAGISTSRSVVGFINFNIVPRWLLLTLASGGFLWIMRGKEISWKIPNSTPFEGAVVVFLLGVSFFASENLPWWIAVPLFWALAIALISADRLASKGHELATERDDSA